MAITLRTLKGTALTYEEVDRNFSQYFYSASIDGENLKLWYTGSDALDLPGSDYGPRVGATIPLNPGTIGPGGTTSAGIRDGNIQYKVGTGFGGGDGFHYDYSNKRVGIGTVIPAVQLEVAASLNSPAKLRLSAKETTTANEGNKAWVEFFKGTVIQAQVGLLKSDAFFYINTPTGNKLQIAEKTKAYLTSAGLGVTGGDFTVIPNQALTVLGAIGVGGGITDVDQSTIGQGTVQVTLLPTSANTTGLLLESQKGTKGGNIVMGLNSTANNNEAFSIIRGLRGTYDRTIATFKADGNVGIGINNPGTTPNNTLLGFSDGSNIQARKGFPQLALSSNIDGDWYNATYKVNGYAAQLVIDPTNMGNGQNGFGFNLAPSGTAGAAITWTRAMTVVANGNVGIGTNSPGTYKLNVNGTTNLGGATNIVGITGITGAVNITGATNITGNTGITGNLSVTGTTTLTGGLTVTGVLSAKNIVGEATGYTPVGTWYSTGGIVTTTVPNSSTGPTIGFHNPNSYGSSIQLTANGEFKFWKQDGTILANVTATKFTGELVGNASTARSIKIGSSETIGDLNISLTDAGTVRFDTYSGGAANKPVGVNNANGVITFAMNHGSQYGKQIAFADNDDLHIRRLTANNYGSWLRLLHSGNYNSYSPTLTGVGASGTWKISIEGNAGSSGLQNRTNEGALSTSFKNTPAGHASWHDGNNEAGAPTAGEWWNIHNMRHSNGGNVYGTQQAYKWGGGIADMYIRQVNNDSFEAWARVFTTSNYNLYSPTLTGVGASGTWNINISGTAGAVAWNNVTSKPSLIMYYQGFTLDANTMDGNSTGFTYSVNAPFTGPIARFSETGYSLQLNASYGGGGNQIAFRTRNGDAGAFNPWRELVSSGNHASFGTVPRGGIIMWSGAVATIPAGWRLCDGGSGTPNLRDRFVVGAGSSYAVGKAEGSANAVVVAHSHPASTSINPNPHTHTIALDTGAGNQDLTTLTTSYANTARSDEQYIGANLLGSVSLYATTTLTDVGESGAGKNLPPYYALAYIMFVG